MTTTTTVGPGTHDEAAALDTVAGMLAARRLGTRTMQVLKITGRRAAATADLAIAPDGTVAWHYHACDGTPPDAARITAVVATLLHATNPPDPPARPRPEWGSWFIPDLDFLAKTATLAVTSHALTAAFGHHSLDHFTIPDMITITSPGRPGRGTVRVTADGTISWHTRIHGHSPGADGLCLTDIASTIALAITTPAPLPD